MGRLSGGVDSQLFFFSRRSRRKKKQKKRKEKQIIRKRQEEEDGRVFEKKSSENGQSVLFSILGDRVDKRKHTRIFKHTHTKALIPFSYN